MQPPDPMPPPTDLAWLAGFIDGEGSIHAWIEKKRPRIKKGLDLTNTSEANLTHALRLIRALTGTDFKPLTTNVAKGYRPCYAIHIRGAAPIDAVLRAVRPWLIGKREHADLMLRLIAIAPRSAPAGRADVLRRTPDNMRFRTCYRDEHFQLVTHLQQLNRRYAPGEWAREQQTTSAGSVAGELLKGASPGLLSE